MEVITGIPKDMDGTNIPVAVTKEENGNFKVVELSGMPLFWDDGSAIEGKTLDKAFKMAERYLKTSTRWKGIKERMKK